jgi:hypothetical protein
MAQGTMYPANAGSPGTTISAGIDADDTSISITELGNLSAAPNQATLDDGTNWEVVVYSEKSAASGAGTITVTRTGTGHEGTAQAFAAGTAIANNPTAYSFDTVKANIEDHETRLTSGKRSIFLSMAGGWTGTTLPDGGFLTTETSTNKVNFRGTNLAASASDQKHEFGCLMPANYDGGTITAKFCFFAPTSADASDHTIILGLQGVSFGDGDVGDAQYGTAQEVTETISSSIAGKIIITAATSAITIAGTPAGEKWTQFRVYREGDDTYTGDITLLGVLISYTTDNYSDE